LGIGYCISYLTLTPNRQQLIANRQHLKAKSHKHEGTQSNIRTESNLDMRIMQNVLIDKMTEDSWNDVARIYNSGIATRNATFEKQAPDWVTWDSAHRKDCRLIAKIGDKIVGWAALSNVSGRCVYSGVAEVSVYVDAEYRGQGIGDKLMKSLINDSESNGIWTLQAGIFPENESSIKVHQKNGFRIIGVREKLGKMDDTWRDVVMLERRSKKIGI
jgi:L-amino acid N-acyltransferase YncA